jgi:hypothetical protein
LENQLSTPEKTPIEHELLKLKVKDFTEQKQGLTYLSWAHAWACALKADPTANFHVHTFEGKPYMDVNGTGMVWVGVTMGGNTRTCWLPVMNHRNQPIQTPDAFQVNTAIMRCLTKCLGMFGLGLNVYAGEDLPLDLDQTEAKEEKKEEVKEEKKQGMTAQEKANMTLFANTLVEYLEIQKTGADLKSYWKSNQGQIDEMKVKMPDLYEIVLGKFKEAKEKANG